MMIKAAINGARPKSENQYLPQSITEIENEVKLLFENGFKVFHIHCYDKDGNESIKPHDVNLLVETVKNISKEIQLGISSGDWIEPDFEKRKSYIKSWENVPDFISVNMIEDNAIEISELLLSKNVKIEAGLNDKKAAQIFAESDLRDGCLRILLEPEPETFSEAIQTVTEMENVLHNYNINIPRLLHGFNSAAWDILKEAKRRVYDGRIGMEDTIRLENGKMVTGNLEIMLEAKRIINSV